MKSLKQTYLINASLIKVWQALTDPKFIDKWGGGPAKMNDNQGSEFSLWGGDIHGTNTKIVKYKLLAQDWFSGDWKKPSQVIFTLEDKKGKTELILIHKNVPDNEIEDIESGWKDYYLGPLKELFD